MSGTHKAGSGLVSFLDSSDRLAASGAAFIGALLVLAGIAIVTYSVVMRYVLNTPQTWTDELVGYFLVSIVMLGVAESLRRGDHIGVDLITERLPAGARRWADMWGMTAVIIVAVSLLISSCQMVLFSYSVELYSEGYVEAPLWIPQMALVIGSAMLVFSASNRLLRLFLGLALAGAHGADSREGPP